MINKEVRNQTNKNNQDAVINIKKYVFQHLCLAAKSKSRSPRSLKQ